MPIDLRSKSGGGGMYSPIKGFALATIPTGASGDILNLSAGSGLNDRVRLEMLAESGAGGEIGITVEIDGIEFITGEINALVGTNTGQFNIFQSGASGNTNAPFTDIVGKNIKVIKNLGVTTNEIRYVYSTGEIK